MSIKLSAKKKEALDLALKEIANIQKEIAVVHDAQAKEKQDRGGIPSEVSGYENMTYKEVIQLALKAENEAIFLGLLAIELAPNQDIKNLVEITNDENDHTRVYEQIIDRLNKDS